MNFWDTVAGHNFTQYQIPRLINALEKVGKELEENNRLLRETKEDKQKEE